MGIWNGFCVRSYEKRLYWDGTEGGAWCPHCSCDQTQTMYLTTPHPVPWTSPQNSLSLPRPPSDRHRMLGPRDPSGPLRTHGIHTTDGTSGFTGTIPVNKLTSDLSILICVRVCTCVMVVIITAEMASLVLVKLFLVSEVTWDAAPLPAVPCFWSFHCQHTSRSPLHANRVCQ